MNKSEENEEKPIYLEVPKISSVINLIGQDSGAMPQNNSLSTSRQANGSKLSSESDQESFKDFGSFSGFVSPDSGLERKEKDFNDEKNDVPRFKKSQKRVQKTGEEEFETAFICEFHEGDEPVVEKIKKSQFE